ncbi:GntR family transcriptional regulator [Novosphingobium flavum]|uniref:GntR family transcriptional regulator n=1 Tax=Novosphingobium flavum TaxID=1778672 RepID=A0A7X1FTK1_9SPHN|nr:GntR family transcriptional regulator [Novosphingobium flavum]MBC2666097.1 GntR family transcriptional regulator [Novosphingobium flavum]
MDKGIISRGKGPRPEPIAQRSLAESVGEALLREIFSARLLPGARVDLAAYAALWDVSITPVRDAAKNLETQGFLKVRARRGVFVAELGPKEVRDIFDVRIALECAAIRLATPDIPEHEIVRAIGLYTDAGTTTDPRERERLLRKVDALIHSIAQKWCGNARLAKLLEELGELVHWCQNTIIAQLDEPLFVTLPEHLGICEAVRARDPERAEQAMRVHLTNTLERIQTFLSARQMRPAA